MNYLPAKPFSNMALSLSGGGYRATAFHLGVLSLLDEIKFSYSESGEKETTLLDRVCVLSTVSGGTILGARFALDAADKNKSFKDTYRKIYDLLNDDTLLEDGFNKFKPTSKWVAPHRNVNLINAFAEVYNEKFYDGKTFKDLFHDPEKGFYNESTLKDIIFNATEFTNSLHFRYQTKGVFGNGKIKIPINVAADIRIADAVASSSCFPSGFEPIEFPRDISNGPNSSVENFWAEEKAKHELAEAEKEKEDRKDFPKSFAIMDGGIVDNQGIDSVLKAEDRNKKIENKKYIHYIGTFIASDVTQELNDYKVLQPSDHQSKMSISFLNKILLVVSLLVGGFLIFSFYKGWNNIGTGIGISVLTLLLTYYGIFFMGWGSLKKMVAQKLGPQKLIQLSNLNILQIVPIQLINFLIQRRVSTTIHMTGSVFMKRIRDLQQDRLFSNKYWNYRFKENYIYTLLSKKNIDLGEHIPRIIRDANGMATSLWFTQLQKEKEKNHVYEKGKDMLKKLIACGQITLCYNLQEYIKDVKKGEQYELLKPSEKKNIEVLEIKLQGLLAEFIATPYWLFDKQGKMVS